MKMTAPSMVYNNTSAGINTYGPDVGGVCPPRTPKPSQTRKHVQGQRTTTTFPGTNPGTRKYPDTYADVRDVTKDADVNRSYPAIEPKM